MRWIPAKGKFGWTFEYNTFQPGKGPEKLALQTYVVLIYYIIMS